MTRTTAFFSLAFLLSSTSSLIASTTPAFPGEEEMILSSSSSPLPSFRTVDQIAASNEGFVEVILDISEEAIPEITLGIMPSEANARHFIEEEGLDFSGKGEERGSKEKLPRIGLSIDGGGIRGLMPAIWLEALEGEIQGKFPKVPLYEVFDYVGGTSIGGILALGVGADLVPHDLTYLLEKEGKNVFSTEGRKLMRIMDFFGLEIHQYSAHNLQRLLQDNFGSITLSEAKTDVLITACTNKSHPWIFKREENKPYKIWEVARCTSAAPTYFSGYKPTLEGYNDHPHLVDGGIWVNNPSTLIAASIVQDYQGRIFKPSKLHMLSLGTGECPTTAIPISTGKKSAGAIIEALMGSHSRGNHMVMSQLLGDNYHRINPELPTAIDLDNTKDRTIQLLRSYAEKDEHATAITTFVDQVEEVIRHKLERD